jgi:hypothetical protein
MENYSIAQGGIMSETNQSSDNQSKNAGKVAGYAVVIAMTGAAAVKTKQFVARKRAERKARKTAPLTVAE